MVNLDIHRDSLKTIFCTRTYQHENGRDDRKGDNYSEGSRKLKLKFLKVGKLSFRSCSCPILM